MGSITLKFTDCIPLPDGQYHKFYLMGSASPAPGINMKGARDARGYILLNFRYLNQDIMTSSIKVDQFDQGDSNGSDGVSQSKSLSEKRKSMGSTKFKLFNK